MQRIVVIHAEGVQCGAWEEIGSGLGSLLGRPSFAEFGIEVCQVEGARWIPEDLGDNRFEVVERADRFEGKMSVGVRYGSLVRSEETRNSVDLTPGETTTLRLKLVPKQ